MYHSTYIILLIIYLSLIQYIYFILIFLIFICNNQQNDIIVCGVLLVSSDLGMNGNEFGNPLDKYCSLTLDI